MRKPLTRKQRRRRQKLAMSRMRRGKSPWWVKRLRHSRVVDWERLYGPKSNANLMFDPEQLERIYRATQQLRYKRVDGPVEEFHKEYGPRPEEPHTDYFEPKKFKGYDPGMGKDFMGIRIVVNPAFTRPLLASADGREVVDIQTCTKLRSPKLLTELEDGLLASMDLSDADRRAAEQLSREIDAEMLQMMLLACYPLRKPTNE